MVKRPLCQALHLMIGTWSLCCIWLDGATNSKIQACQIGLSPAGDVAAPNGWDCIALVGNTSGVVIGGTTSAQRNVLSGSSAGVVIDGLLAKQNVVSGNWIGLSADGKNVVGNSAQGIRLYWGANNNTVGPGNVVCGSASDGILLQHEGTTNNSVLGNKVGLMPDGATIGGNWSGIAIWDRVSNNLIGGPDTAARNIVVGNNDGIRIGAQASWNTVQGNWVGCRPNTAAGTANNWSGIALFARANNNRIVSNVVSGNKGAGIYVSGAEAQAGLPNTEANLIKGNLIGTNGAGSVSWPNIGQGVLLVNGARKNQVEDNVVSGNDSDGIAIADPGTSANLIQANKIGANAAGTGAIRNRGAQIWLGRGASLNTFQGNLISGGIWDGVYVSGPDTAGNVFWLNTVGSPSGDPAMGNRFGFFFNDSGPNEVGGSLSKANVIRGNRKSAVMVYGQSSGISIRGNTISDNSEIGINLYANEGPWGVTANDAGDLDSGPNGLTNFPSIALTGLGPDLKATATLSAKASTAYIVDFYAVEAADASGHGEGGLWVGSRTVTTGSNGLAKVTVTVPMSARLRTVLATATEVSSGSTSEFGPVDSGLPIPVLNITDITGGPGQPPTVTIVLLDRLTGVGIANQMITLILDGAVIGKPKSDANGVATFTFASVPSSGSHVLKAKYAGSAGYRPNTATLNFVMPE